MFFVCNNNLKLLDDNFQFSYDFCEKLMNDGNSISLQNQINRLQS